MGSKYNADEHQSQEDKFLLDELKNHSHSAFEQIYAKYWQTLYSAAFNLLGDQQSCDDLIQELFIWIWENRERHITTALKPYMQAAVRYKVANLIRHGKVKSDHLKRSLEAYNLQKSQFQNNYEIRELQSVIEHFAESLPPKSREIFKMSRFELLSNKEIAANLGISEKTVENQITISLKKLRKLLGARSYWMIFL